MSARTTTLAWVLTLLAAGALLLATIPRARRVERQAHAELATFTRTAAQARDLAALRADPAALPSRPEAIASARLAPEVSATLVAAGLPASAIASLSPESESAELAEGQTRILRRRATLVLTPLTLPQLGRFLQTWQLRQTDWTVTRLDLEPPRDGSAAARSAAPGGDLPLRIVIGLESLTLDPSRGTR